MNQVAKKSTASTGVRKTPSPSEDIVPPDAIPVQIVTGADGKPVIIMNSTKNNAPVFPATKPTAAPMSRNITVGSISIQSKPHMNRPTHGPGGSRKTVKNRSSEQRSHGALNSDAIARDIVNRASAGAAASRNIRPGSKSNSSSPRFMWEAPVTHNNVEKILRRVTNATDSLTMVLKSLQRETDRSYQLNPQLAVEKRGVIAVKLKTSIGAFKRQLQSMEEEASRTKRMDPYSNMLRPSQYNRTLPAKKRAPAIAPKKPEVIELSDSSDEEQAKATTTKSTRPLSKSVHITVNYVLTFPFLFVF